MEKLKELVNNFLEYTCLISIPDDEFYEKYECKLADVEIEYLKARNELDLEIDRMAKADILYDFIFNIEAIKEQLENDIDSWGTNTYEFREIKSIYKDIQKVFPNFKIERIEEVK